MDNYLKSIKEGLKESVEFFGNKNKQEREKWILKEFLSYLPVQFAETDIRESNTEPHDVFFKSFGFQVKEILTEGRMRGKEYKEKLNSISSNTKPGDFSEQYNPIHIPLTESLPRVFSELARHRTEKYYDNTSSIDVLVYLNLSDTTYTNEQINVSQVSAELNRWRSVSLVSNNCAAVLHCNDCGNQLLRPLVGNLYGKN